MKFDDTDKEILRLLQQDATLPRAEIAKNVNLSTTPCWRRIQKLKDSLVIKKEVALLDRDMLNVGLTAFVTIRTNQHNVKWFKKFAEAIENIPEVMECYRMSGDIDYLIRIVVPDVKAYDSVYNQLIQAVEIHDVSTSFAMEDIKYTTALPMDYV